MHIAKAIDYYQAKAYFAEAELRGSHLLLGDINTNFWLHKERINLDIVIEFAKKFSDSKIFIISEGNHKGFYIYSEKNKDCIKLVEETTFKPHGVIA